MLKGRGRDPRSATSPVPAHLASVIRAPASSMRPPALKPGALRPATPTMHRSPLAKPEPDYEVVEFPSDQYVNAKIQPPPPPPPRPPTGHPVDAGASCGLCGGGGARVRCTECDRRALCASCDDMYHRHPKRRHHQRQALSQSQLREERPPLPPKATPPVPPPRKHKMSGDRMSASPKPPVMDQRRATLSSPHHAAMMMMGTHGQAPTRTPANHIPPQHAQNTMHQQMPLHLQTKMTTTPTPHHLGSMPYLPTNMHVTAAQHASAQGQSNTLTHMNAAWNRPRGSLQGFDLHPNMAVPDDQWENSEMMAPTMQSWGRPLRRGASVRELSGGGAPACAGCAHCAPMPWRYGSCVSLDHPWANTNPGWAPTCCPPGQPAHMQPYPHIHPPQTPQPYRRAESRTVSRAASRAGSRAASPAMSVRSRTSRRMKHRTPSPPPLPSSDADSESESESDHGPPSKPQEREDDSLGPAPPPPSSTWQCEHCTYVNEAGIRVCAICCRTPVTVPKTIMKDISENVERLKITHKESRSPARIIEEPRFEREVEKPKKNIKKERMSTGCQPSPPREENAPKKTISRLVTPTRESNTNNHNDKLQGRHDMAVGPSPPREIRNGTRTDMSTEISPSHETNKTMRVSPFRNSRESPRPEPPKRHNISVGPSPPRDNAYVNAPSNFLTNVQKKSTGTSPPRDAVNERQSNVSNTGTSPPPQSISTQTYEVPNPNAWERAASASRSRPRRRFQDDSRRERSQSRHSMSSDTRESERSVRTAGTGPNRWEWRERDSSPGGEWGDHYSRLSRRASHLDLRRNRPNRRSTYYGSEAPSPERQSTRAISLEALTGAGAMREAERGIELAQLMGEAERLGFSAAEVQAALTQSPASPLAWLRERWPSLCAGVRAAAARLAPDASITELEARAALARHRGAMWPAVTECVERHKRQTEVMGVGEEGRLRGHVWGSPVGADDDAAPPRSSSRHSHRMRAEDSSDEFEAPTPPRFQDDDWMYLPLNININDYEREANPLENKFTDRKIVENTGDVAKKLKMLLQEAGVPLIHENLLLQGILSGNASFEPETNPNISTKAQPIDLIQSENDFIDAYNALTRSSPLPNINEKNNNTEMLHGNKLVLQNELNEKQIPNSNKFKLNNLKSELLNGNEFQQTAITKQSSEIKEISNKPSKSESSKIKEIINKPSKSEETGNKLLYTGNGLSQPIETQTGNTVLNIENEKKSSEITLEKIGNVPKNINKSGENNTDSKIHREIEEKSNNLTDIVDNTQRLIQQMKEEINSDINSIDGRTVSQSDEESSTDETNDEQESSYSDTEERTENLTSDEKEITSSEDEEPSEKRQAVHYITSSEENENFEEALDHVENQLEDFKLANIEMLDSIARTLQEEHSLTVEVNEPQKQEVVMPPKKEDVNNNKFISVNSFEEIYDELNTQNNVDKVINNEQTVIQNPVNNLIPHLQLFAREAIILSTIQSIAPTKLVISKTIHPVLNAVLETLEQKHNDNHINNQDIELQQKEPVSVTKEIITQLGSEESDVKSSSDDHSNQTLLAVVKEPQQSVPADSERAPPLALNIEENNRSNVNSLEDNPSDSEQAGSTNYGENMVPEQLPVNTPSDNSIKNTITNKSNIPKLIRIMPNNKSKNDKNTPKLIVSKVPVRRTSIKQYPAPAPPKSHFGNIQSGHVKQLQTRLFNNKANPSQPIPTTSEIPEAKATTSTLNKKKQAPPPPLKYKEDKKLPSPKTTTPPKEKKPFFRETCHTEDDWTDSDSEDAQSLIIKPTEESIHSPPTPPSPPPPVTVRKVSGQIIDLAKVRLPEGSPERQARMLLAEGATETWEQAQLAVELITQGADPPAALLAALECVDLSSALAYLYQDCELCASRLPEHEMVSMLRCTHRCCRECAHHYFTVQITERSIADCVCPYCKLPELESLPEDAWLEYFAHLDILLKTLLEVDVHELFQRKLRDRTLARDPNFRWCMECSSGFFVHPKQKKIRCPECRSISCASCRKPWNTNHEGLSCEQYTAWLEDNDPERSVTAIQQHLRDNGLECPRCHFKYSLSRGGCMHFTCSQCKYEFCYGCGKPFTMGARCGLSDYCAKLGLHSHHPRNCLFYLRDKEPHELQTLLQMNNVVFETNAAEGSAGRCPIQLQRETPTGLVDGTCGNEAPNNYAGLCKTHYVEYLAGLARGLDPIPIMDVSELVAELRRRALPLPERGPWDTDPIYAGMCAEIVKEKIPLD